METYKECIIVTDWEKVEADDVYLGNDWAGNVYPANFRWAKELQAENNLFIAYVVPAVNYCTLWQMDSQQIFIDRDGNEIMQCEGAVITNKHEKCFECNY